MQTLYASSQDGSLTLAAAQKMFKKRVQESFDLYLFSLHLLVDVASYARADLENRKGKYLPSDEDRNFSSILYDNPALTSLWKNEYFQIYTKKKNFKERYDLDLTKRLYKEFVKTESYLPYVTKKQWEPKEHIAQLHDLLRFLKNHDTFNEIMEDAYANWVDDKSLVIGTAKRTLKALPIDGDYFDKHYPPTDTVKEFGEELLLKVESRKGELEEIIKPVLENWDMDRLALIDTIALKMAIAELLYFPSIPIKVTINEYVEMVKNYSTDKSKEFINGILDKVMNELKKAGRINKSGRGLID